MNITFHCGKCEQPTRCELTEGTAELSCAGCQAKVPVTKDDLVGGQVQACVACGCRELFIRKDFSQRLGVTIVVVGLLGSSIAWAYHWRYVTYAILFVTALIDLVLYVLVGNLLQCYRCHAEYRGLTGLEEFEPFDLETHERFRQQAIRLAEANRAAKA